MNKYLASELFCIEENLLQDLNYIKFGSLELIQGEVMFSIKEDLDTSVYICLAETEDSKIIPLYFVKAGKSLKKRMNESVNGFKERNSGKKKRDDLQILLDQKIKVDIFYRKSLVFDSKKNAELDLSYPNYKFNTPTHLITESLEEIFLIELIKTKFHNKKLLPLNYMSDKNKNQIETNYQDNTIN